VETYPIQTAEGSLIGFEIGNTWLLTHRPIFKILRSVDGVSDVQSRRNDGDRISFHFKGESFIVHEPWGDSSRYWIGPVDTAQSKVDITPLQQAFQHYHGPIARMWARLGGGSIGA
jgi:hypothetical protein